MTYQEKIEALPGALCDYDDVCQRTILIMMTHMLLGSCMVSMVWRKMEYVMILIDRMFVVMGLFSTELGLMTGQLALYPYENDGH